MIVGLFASLVLIQIPIVFVWGASHDGCTKYVSLSTVESLIELVSVLWAIGLILNAAILMAYQTRFFRYWNLFGDKSVVISWVCLFAWKAIALPIDLHAASICGEARDYYYPEYFAWLGRNFSFWASIFLL